MASNVSLVGEGVTLTSGNDVSLSCSGVSLNSAGVSLEGDGVSLVGSPSSGIFVLDTANGILDSNTLG